MTRFRFASAITVSVLATGLVTAAPALADPDPTTGVELNVPTSQFVATPVTFDFSDSRTEGIKALKEYRARAWDLNLPFDGTPIRQKAAEYGLNTKEAYVNAVRSDGGLTRIAVQRAAENSYRTKNVDGDEIVHSRPTSSACQLGAPSKCDSIWTATYKGKQGWHENLANNSQNAGIGFMIKTQWGKGEEAGLIAANGAYAGGGHLYSLINPAHRYFGFGYVKGTNGLYTGASTSSSTPIEADNLPAGVQTTNLYRAAKKGQNPTGIISGTPSKPTPKPSNPTTEKPTPKPTNPTTEKPTPKPDQNNPGNQGNAASVDFNNISSNSDILSSDTATDGQKAAAGIGLAVAILGILGVLVNVAQQAGLITF